MRHIAQSIATIVLPSMSEGMDTLGMEIGERLEIVEKQEIGES